MAKGTIVLVLALAAVLILGPTAVQAGQAAGISAPFVTEGVGDTFSIPISIAFFAELTSWQFDLGFNPAIVQANSVTEGPFMSSFGTTLFSPGVIDNTAGLISLVTDSYVDLPPNPTGTGVAANIQFTALAGGVSPFTFSNVSLNGLDSGFDIGNGQSTVTGAAAVPEPATLMLLGGGLALLGGRRLAKRVSPNSSFLSWTTTS